MKYYLTLILVAALILLTSCEKLPESRIGFSSPITKDANGLAIVHLGSRVDSIKLQGSIALSEGAVEVRLTNPAGEVVYTIELQYPDDLQMDRSFSALPGNWKLQYKSRNGIGNIDLHVNY
jgi:hypothetical protein